MKVDLTRTAAIAIFTAIGIITAAKWNPTRMKAKLAKLDEMIDDDTKIKDKGVQADINKVLKAIKAGGEITVAKDAPTKGKGKADAKTETAAAKKKRLAAEKDAAKGKGKTGTAKPPAKDTPAGVRETKTRAFCAGQVVAKHGIKAGITDAMVAEVNELYGKDNDAESMGRLKNVWHGVRGYLEATA